MTMDNIVDHAPVSLALRAPATEARHEAPFATASAGAGDGGPAGLKIAFLMHEFRSHLNVVVNTSKLLMEHRSRLGGMGSSLLSAQAISSDLLMVLVDDLSAVLLEGRMDFRTDLRPVALRPWLEDWHLRACMLPGADGGRSALRLSMQACDPLVLADVSRLNQCLQNLLSNAQKYGVSPAGTTLGLCVDDGEARISVQDRGAGMTSEQVRRLFVPFDRLGQAATVPGQGLGLALTKTLVEAMGARLEVHTAPGLGSTFALVFRLLP